ncbi:hypothetical protein QFC22_006481 [Naganishia vaughanmartiniae]|uniref:Uncharacterized protein n=1 Tax=Naganishia vaughanmartiniae TaxID=1424756 RepID=A0ACC2WIN1_9TREE|nr:hypothetical protein QFC22_006481 [Naganishia vaughanmartiniae]
MCVLELGKLIESALWIHGLYGHLERYYQANQRWEQDEAYGEANDNRRLALAIWETGVDQILEGGTTSSPARTTARGGSITGAPGGGIREWELVWGLEEGECEDLCMDPVRRKVRVDAIPGEPRRSAGGKRLEERREKIRRLVEPWTHLKWRSGAAKRDEFTSLGPNLTALLLSEVVSVRCKLAALDINVPRDPFAKPGEFLLALREYQRAFHPSRTTTDYLTPRLLEEINISYAKAQVHESSKLSKIMKGKIAQVSAEFASNLTGLASATLGSATSTGRYHGASDDEGSDKDAREVSVAGAVDEGSASNLATDNVDRWVSCIKSGKEGLGNRRAGNLWLAERGNGQGKQWLWDTPRKIPLGSSSVPISSFGMDKRRNTHGPHSQSVRDRTSLTAIGTFLQSRSCTIGGNMPNGTRFTTYASPTLDDVASRRLFCTAWYRPVEKHDNNPDSANRNVADDANVTKTSDERGLRQFTLLVEAMICAEIHRAGAVAGIWLAR